jgi:hypothetical protein
MNEALNSGVRSAKLVRHPVEKRCPVTKGLWNGECLPPKAPDVGGSA